MTVQIDVFLVGKTASRLEAGPSIHTDRKNSDREKHEVSEPTYPTY